MKRNFQWIEFNKIQKICGQESSINLYICLKIFLKRILDQRLGTAEKERKQ